METAFQKAKMDWMSNPNINGVFISRRRKGKLWTTEPVIQFHVRKKFPLDKVAPEDIIPSKIEGVPTDVIQANAIPASDINRYAAIQGGMSIGNEESVTAGTMGIVILDENNGPVGITNAHCILIIDAETPTPGHPIHPGIDDGGIAGRDRIGTILNWDLNTVDAAGIQLDYPYGLSVFDTLVIPNGFRTPEIDDVLHKLGRTTSLTEMKVSGYGTTTTDYSAFNIGSLTFDGVLCLIPNGDDPNELIVLAGDSGSFCYYPDTFEGAGLVFALAVETNIAYAFVFGSVLSYCGVNSPVVSPLYESERKGSANIVVPAAYEVKGSAILSGSGPVFSTRLTAVNQDTTIGYPIIQDLFAAGGIRFLDGTETEESEGGTLPTWTDTPTEWSDTPVAWGDYSPSSTIVVPTYVDADTFSVNGDNTIDYPVGLKLKLIQGTGLDAVVAIVSALYNGEANKTYVTVDPASVLVSITQVKFGLLPAQLPIHSHSSIKETYTQASHGFVVQQAIYRNGSTWAKAKADTVATAEAIGVIESIDGNDFTVVFAGAIGGLSGLTPGASYFVSAVTAGLIATDEPDANLYVSKPILNAVTSTTGLVNNMRGLGIAQ